MRNPFADFKHVAPADIGIPLERMVADSHRVRSELLAGYRSLPPDQVKELRRLLAHGLNFNVYKSFLLGLEMPKFLAATLKVANAVYESGLKSIRSLEYTVRDIEELCAYWGLSSEARFEQTSPMGLFVSALINRSNQHIFDLNLYRYRRTLHFMGFGLPQGKRLAVVGSLGHFSGAGLQGGDLEVKGSTGSWCGADMAAGRIKIYGDARAKTGAQMTGGQIWVQGQILEIAKHRVAGEIRSDVADGVRPDAPIG